MNIFVFGHSLSEIDKPHFEVLKKYFPQASWCFSYYSDAADMKVKIDGLGLDEYQVVALKPLEIFEWKLFVNSVECWLDEAGNSPSNQSYDYKKRGVIMMAMGYTGL